MYIYIYGIVRELRKQCTLEKIESNSRLFFQTNVIDIPRKKFSSFLQEVKIQFKDQKPNHRIYDFSDFSFVINLKYQWSEFDLRS